MENAKSLLVIGGLARSLRIFMEKSSRQPYKLKVFDSDDAVEPGYIRYTGAEVIRGDTEEYKKLRDSMQHCNTVLRFSDLSSLSTEEGYKEFPFGKEIQGTLNTLEAARKTGIKQYVQLLPQPIGRKLRGHLFQLTSRLIGEIARDFAESCDMNISFLSTGVLFDPHSGSDSHGKQIKARGVKGLDLFGFGDLSITLQRILELQLQGYHEYYVAGSVNALQKYEVKKSLSELNIQLEDEYIFNGKD